MTTTHRPAPETGAGFGGEDLIRAYIAQFSNWGRWGADDQLGTLNFVGPEQVKAYKGVDALEPGFAIGPEELDGTAAAQGVEIRSGDCILIHMGMPFGEVWDLEGIAADCAADGVYEFLLSATALPITGACGTPLNPVAVK